jgi:octaheme c-type cytochrome (tetrathionate reductase family)
MKKTHLFSLLCAGGLIFTAQANAVEEHREITGPFENPMAVTRKCLECHDTASHDIMQTTHWNWQQAQDLNGGKNVHLGKKNAINNFCISISGNWARCTSCHIGYGWRDGGFDFTDAERVDCLVCHDTTGTYKKPGPAAGMPAGFTGNGELDKKPVDLLNVAQNVGNPGRDNCLVCHGNGGGGDNVKHGDLESSLSRVGRDIDVHLGTDGQDFTCQTCHTTDNHKIKGNAMVVSPNGNNHVFCTDCHDQQPHRESLLNSHGDTVACQTCHIPEYAKVLPTKLYWDWSAAGRDMEAATDEYGMVTYDKKKGEFVWGKNVIPAYAWYNGRGSAYLPGDKIDPSEPTFLSRPEGDITDMTARIHPFKVHRGKQIYDAVNGYLITPKVHGKKDDPDAYWVNFDWQKAAAAGMKASGLPYSGEYDFAPTVMYWSINHMVVPADQALGCLNCHGDQGRLDWQALGYKADPMRDSSAARTK